MLLALLEFEQVVRRSRIGQVPSIDVAAPTARPDEGDYMRLSEVQKDHYRSRIQTAVMLLLRLGARIRPKATAPVS